MAQGADPDKEQTDDLSLKCARFSTLICLLCVSAHCHSSLPSKAAHLAHSAISVSCRCQKAAKLQCPKCLELGLPKQPSAFCSQECFKVRRPCTHGEAAATSAVPHAKIAFLHTADGVARAQAGAQGWPACLGVCCAAGQGPQLCHAPLQLDGPAAAHHGLAPERGSRQHPSARLCRDGRAHQRDPEQATEHRYMPTEDDVLSTLSADMRPDGPSELACGAAVPVRSAEDIEGTRQACLVARRILDAAHAAVQPGVTTDEIDRIVRCCLQLVKCLVGV